MLDPTRLEGVFTAIVTPFRDGALDLEALDRLIDRQLAAGVAGIVPCGTTGESPSLNSDEWLAVVSRTVHRVAARAQVVAGTGTNNTRESIERTRAARAAGAGAAMIVMPYYNRPGAAGLVAHVRAVHDATELPLMLYNVPGRTASDLGVDGVAAIVSTCPRVRAIKEASGSVLRTQQLVATSGRRLTVLAGDDALTLAAMACGARGVVSVTSNVAPREVRETVEAADAGDFVLARQRHFALVALHDALFVESNPGPVKAALAALGLIAPELRLPLTWPTQHSCEVVTAALRGAGIAT